MSCLTACGFESHLDHKYTKLKLFFSFVRFYIKQLNDKSMRDFEKHVNKQVAETEDGSIRWALGNPAVKENLLKDSRATLLEMERKLDKEIEETIEDSRKKMLENNLSLVEEIIEERDLKSENGWLNYIYDNKLSVSDLHKIENDVLLDGAERLYEEIKELFGRKNFREKVIVMMKNLEKMEDALQVRNVERNYISRSQTIMGKKMGDLGIDLFFKLYEEGKKTGESGYHERYQS